MKKINTAQAQALPGVAAVLTAQGRLEKVTTAHDIGRAINPTGVEGQVEGGVVMALGYALTEDFPLEEGVPTAKFGTLRLVQGYY